MIDRTDISLPTRALLMAAMPWKVIWLLQRTSVSRPVSRFCSAKPSKIWPTPTSCNTHTQYQLCITENKEGFTEGGYTNARLAFDADVMFSTYNLNGSV